MRGLFTNQLFTVQPGQVVSGVARQAQTLRIQRGRVWITVEGISHDYFLHAGDTFTAIPGRLVVLEADHEAQVDSRRPSALQALRGMRGLLAAIAQRMTRGAAVQTSMRRHRTCSDVC
ncbi:MAG: DUF2917 domain-containing protein [Noviherbaspirillum sp.]